MENEMKNFKYVFLFLGLSFSYELWARDSELPFSEYGDLVRRSTGGASSVAIEEAEEDVGTPEIQPTSLQVQRARALVQGTISTLTLADIFAPMRGSVSSKLEGWSSEDTSAFLKQYEDDVQQKRKLLHNLRVSLDQLKSVRKKKKGHAGRVSALEERIAALESEVEGLAILENEESMGSIGIEKVSMSHEYSWNLTVVLRLRGADGILPEHLVSAVNSRLRFLVDIPVS
jgi:hypothetical protein